MPLRDTSDVLSSNYFRQVEERVGLTFHETNTPVAVDFVILCQSEAEQIQEAIKLILLIRLVYA